MKVRVYWEMRNLGLTGISVRPHQHTQVLTTDGEIYESEACDFTEPDYFSIGESVSISDLPSGVVARKPVIGGYLTSDTIAKGGVNVDNIPANASIEKIIFDDIKFRTEFEINV